MPDAFHFTERIGRSDFQWIWVVRSDAADRDDPKRNGRPDRIARAFPLSVATTPRVPRFTPYLGVTTAKYCAPTTQSARLRGLLRHATANSAIHTVVPRKQHLSRFDPPKHPLWTGCQTAYKPGSVPSPGVTAGGGDGHSSGTLVTERLLRPTRAAAWRLAWRIGPLRDACRSYLVLLPVGFSLPPPLPAARCALTAPFHPCLPPGMPETGWRCTFCGTFPGVAPAGGYPAPHLRGARTFLSPRTGEERPSDRLATRDLGSRGSSVKAPAEAFIIGF